MKKAFIASIVMVLLISALCVGIGVTSGVTSAACSNTPSVPGGPSPVNGSVNIPINPILSWGACDNTSYYQVYLDINALPVNSLGTTNYSNIISTNLSYNTTYYWQVVAFNNSTCNTSGPIWRFTTANMLPSTPTPTPTSTSCAIPAKPLIPSPTNSSANTSTTIVLTWNASANASYYEISFGTSEPLIYYGSTDNSSFQLPPLNINTKYYWKVLAKNACGICSSDTWNFTTGCPVPARPQIASPMNGSDQIAIYDAYLSWNTSTGARLYDIYFGTSTTPPYYGNTSNSSYQLPQLNQSTKYYWKVAARNDCGINSSDIWNFITGCPVAVRPKTPSPTNSSTDTSTNILLSWNASANASYYEVYFGTSEPPEYRDSPDNNNYQLPQLNINTKYYWKVVAKSVCDIASSDIWNFTTGCPVPRPQNPSPVNGSEQISIYAYLSWNASANTSLYNAVLFDVYFGASDPPTYYGNTSNSSYQLPQLDYSTTYYWKILSFNNSTCNASGPVWSFKTADAPSPTPTLRPTPQPTPTLTEMPALVDNGGSLLWLWIVEGLDGALTLVLMATIFIIANRRSHGKREASGKRLPGLFRIFRLRRAPTPPKEPVKDKQK